MVVAGSVTSDDDRGDDAAIGSDSNKDSGNDGDIISDYDNDGYVNSTTETTDGQWLPKLQMSPLV